MSLKNSLTFNKLCVLYCALSTILFSVLSYNLHTTRKEIQIFKNGIKYGNIDYEKVDKLIEENTNHRFEVAQLILLEDSKKFKEAIYDVRIQLKENNKNYELINKEIEDINKKIRIINFELKSRIQ